MILQNNSRRLITVNGQLVQGQRSVSYQIKCGLDNKCDVPDDLCDNAFIKGLIATGDLVKVGESEQPVSVDGLDDMTKAELTEYAEAMEIEVHARWNKTDLIEAIRSEQ